MPLHRPERKHCVTLPYPIVFWDHMIQRCPHLTQVSHQPHATPHRVQPLLSHFLFSGTFSNWKSFTCPVSHTQVFVGQRFIHPTLNSDSDILKNQLNQKLKLMVEDL